MISALKRCAAYLVFLLATTLSGPRSDQLPKLETLIATLGRRMSYLVFLLVVITLLAVAEFDESWIDLKTSFLGLACGLGLCFFHVPNSGIQGGASMFVKVVLCAVVWLVSAYTAAYPWLLWPGIDPSVATGMFDRRWLNLVVMVIFMVLIACCQFKRHPPSALAYDAKWCVFGSWLELLAIILYEVAKANERLAHDSNHLMDFFLCMAYSIESVVLAWTLGAFRCHISSLQLSKNELPCGWIYIMSLALIAQVLVNVIQRYFDTTSFSLLLSILLLAVFLVILATYTAKFCLVLSRGLHVLLVEASRVEGSARRNMIWAAKVLRLELTVVFLFGVTVFVAWSCIFAIRVLKLASEEDYGTLRGRRGESNSDGMIF